MIVLSKLRQDPRYLDMALILIGVIVLATETPNLNLMDGAIRYKGLDTLLAHGIDTKMKYSFIGPLFGAPLWYLGRVVESSRWWIGRFNLIVFLAGLLTFWVILRTEVDRGLLRKFLILLMAASMFPGHLPYYYGEVFTAVLVGTGLAIVTIRRSWTGWAAVAIGVANTPATIGGLVLVVGKRMLDSRRLRYLLAGAAAVALITAETWIRHRQLIDRAYSTDHGPRTLAPYSGRAGFGYPFFFGLVSILFSFGKGLLFYVPGILLPVRRALQRVNSRLWELYVLWVLFVVGLVLVYSRWWAWQGGGFWGPRFFLFASIPACLALAVRVHSPSAKALPNLLVMAVLALSVWVAINGAVYSGARLALCRQNGFSLEQLCFFVPEFSVLFRPVVYSKHALTTHDLAFIAFAVVVFVRMAVPLVMASLGSSRDALARARVEYLDMSAWRP